jgi:photosystem II stability/assembly factor-like uncharacterized protein
MLFMKYATNTLLLLFAWTLCLTTPASAQWTKLTGGYSSQLLLNDVYARGQDITAVGYRFSDFQNHIFKSHDAGAHWDTLQPFYAGFLFLTIAHKDKDTGFIGGYGSKALWMRTVDAGQHWDYFGWDSVYAGVSDMVFVDSKRGFAGGYGKKQFYSGHCYYTPDGGNSWLDQNASDPSPLDSLGIEYIDFLDPQTGYAISNFIPHKYILKTTDSGKHWSLLYTHSTIVNGMYFWNVSNGIMVDVHGDIYKTQGGGKNWTKKTSPVTTELISVSFANAKDGFAVGAGGVILKSKDGGETWTKEASPTSEDLFRVKFFEGKGYAVGNAGTIVRSASVVGISEKPLAYQLNVYPNPARDVLNISVTAGAAIKRLSASLIDIEGKVVASGVTEQGLLRFNTAQLAGGQYTVSIDADGKQYHEVISIVH